MDPLGPAGSIVVAVVAAALQTASAPAASGVFSLDRLRLGGAGGVETYVYTAGNVVFPQGGVDTGRSIGSWSLIRPGSLAMLPRVGRRPSSQPRTTRTRSHRRPPRAQPLGGTRLTSTRHPTVRARPRERRRRISTSPARRRTRTPRAPRSPGASSPGRDGLRGRPGRQTLLEQLEQHVDPSLGLHRLREHSRKRQARFERERRAPEHLPPVPAEYDVLGIDLEQEFELRDAALRHFRRRERGLLEAAPAVQRDPPCRLAGVRGGRGSAARTDDRLRSAGSERCDERLVHVLRRGKWACHPVPTRRALAFASCTSPDRLLGAHRRDAHIPGQGARRQRERERGDELRLEG